MGFVVPTINGNWLEEPVIFANNNLFQSNLVSRKMIKSEITGNVNIRMQPTKNYQRIIKAFPSMVILKIMQL